jgi:MarR family transcriptional regulator, 2-MHQ and catechol-resistance regulon repressor
MPTLTKLPQADAAALTEALSDLIRVIQFRDRDRACCYGLSVSQCYALKAVVERRDMTVNDLAATLYLDKSTASRLVNGLVEDGFVTKEADPMDRRVMRLAPTPRGEAVYTAIHRELVREYSELLEELDAAGRAAVVKTVRRLASGFAARVETGGGSCCVVR